MFGIGTGELLIIALVALIVLGPERLPKAARFAGLWIRRGRAQWYSVKSELERELAAEELKRSVQDAKRSIADVGTQLRDAEARVRDNLDEARKGAEAIADDVARAPGDAPATHRTLDTPAAAPVVPEVVDLPAGAIAGDPTQPPVTLPPDDEEHARGAAR
ncbi:MAG: Sec-independent protein translocase protein TatB [Luteimonas sp.]